MTNDGRIPCIVPACRRTAPADKYEAGTQIICGRCWRALVPPRLRHRHKLLNAELRRVNRKRAPDPVRIERLDRMHCRNWAAIRRAVRRPGLPAGLGAFLEETGL